MSAGLMAAVMHQKMDVTMSHGTKPVFQGSGRQPDCITALDRAGEETS
jgi:hypothetical protein